ncbi:MAG: D-2-hydroxyacid dehydrogenase [Sphaerobacter sp.]|nr:D-2-hydroxyacid dehydrogenase [Sphaerobacter sp.]
MAELTRLVLGVELDPTDVARIREAYPDLEVVVCADPAGLPAALAGAQALVAWQVPPEALAAATALRWVHFPGAGVDSLLTPELRARELVVTNNRGVAAPNIAEHLLAMMLAFARGLPELLRAQVRHEWGRPTRRFELGGQTLGIVGLGEIGEALATRAAALGMRVVGLRRRSGPAPRGVARVYPPEGLHALLGESDHVAICLPLTPRTRHLFGPAEFRAMRRDAYLYNIGRGAIVDQAALIAALQAGEIAGAGLDVTDPEPLPPDSPLWDMPNVIITAHTAGGTPRYWDRAIEILLENIGRFRRDAPLRNVVDQREGY